METTTINKTLTETFSPTGFIKFEASRTASEPFSHIDAYVYSDGSRVGYATVDRGKRLSFYQESPDRLTGTEWISAYTKIQEGFDRIMNETNPITL